MNLIADIESIVAEFSTQLADAIVELLKASSTSELVETLGGGSAPSARGASRAVKTPAKKAGTKPATTGSGRLARRSPEQINEAVDTVKNLLAKHPDGLRSEQIREELGLDKREVPRLLKQGVDDGRLRILHGEKRSTTYGMGGSGRKAAPKAAKKGAKKPVKRAVKKTKKPVRKPVKRAAPKKAKKPTHQPSKPAERPVDAAAE